MTDVGDELCWWQVEYFMTDSVDLVTNIQKITITNIVTETFYDDVDGRPKFLKIEDVYLQRPKLSPKYFVTNIHHQHQIKNN